MEVSRGIKVKLVMDVEWHWIRSEDGGAKSHVTYDECVTGRMLGFCHYHTVVQYAMKNMNYVVTITRPACRWVTRGAGRWHLKSQKDMVRTDMF